MGCAESAAEGLSESKAVTNGKSERIIMGGNRADTDMRITDNNTKIA